MMNTSYSHYFSRVIDCLNFDDEPFAKGIRHGASSDKLKHLFADCFSHHTRYHNHTVKALEWDGVDASRWIKVDTLNAYFVAHKYRIPKLFCREQKTEIKYDTFLNDLNSPSFSEDVNADRFKLGSNRIRYIVGDVGSGKTSFIRRLINDLECTNEKNSGKYNNICVYIDCEDVLNPHQQPKQIGDEFYEHIFNRMMIGAEGVDQAIRASSAYSLTGKYRPTQAILSAVADMKDLGHRFTIFIDNLDFYHYHYARYAFFDKYREQQDVSILDNITDLLKRISSEQYLGYAGLNIVVAFRDSVWKNILNQSPGTRIERETAQTIRLETISEDDVIGSRIELFKEACDIYTANSNRSSTNIKKLIAEIEHMFHYTSRHAAKSAVKTIYGLGQHGYRSLVDFFSNLDISASEYDLFDRFFVQQSDTLINLYINKHKKKYTQQMKHFPNLFLSDCVISFNRNFPEAHKTHLHTYWAKYLVLRLVEFRGRTKVRDILGSLVFVDKGYEEHLIRHCIGSLCTANESRCIELVDDEVINTTDGAVLKTTSRGETILDPFYGVPFCFSYRYLSSIVDDKWFCFPVNCMEYLYQQNLNFDHLYYLGDSYAIEGAKFVKSRAIQIAILIKILEISWNEEIIHYRQGLSGLINIAGISPDFDTIKREFLASVNAILFSINRNAGRGNQEGVKNGVVEILDGTDPISSNIEKMIHSYYANPCEIF